MQGFNPIYNSVNQTKKCYKDQLIHYYNLGIGKTSEIAGVIITKELISTIEKRYTQLGGVLPIDQKHIDAKKGEEWSL